MSKYVSVVVMSDGPIKVKQHDDWPSCETEIQGISASFGKKFPNETMATLFMDKIEREWGFWQRTVRMNEHITAYVDGGCKVKNKIASWGLAIYAPEGNVLFEDCGIVGKGNSPIPIPADEYIAQRQIAGELYAAVRAGEWASKNDAKIIIAYDYLGIMYHANDIWPPKTTLQHWYKAQMDKAQNHITAWRWIRGHTGIPGNEKADSLATKAISEYEGTA